jgi:hypothetical protein
MFRVNMKAFHAKTGQLVHGRKPTTPDNQTVIRSNQDTLYSGVVLDLSKPVKITLRDAGERYISMHVINQDHYMFVETEPGTYDLDEDSVGTRFAWVLIRTFVDPADPADFDKVHAIQDAITVSGGGTGPFDAPQRDEKALAAGRKALDDGRLNCIPITPAWNYAIRLYEPHPEILDGSWTFPKIQPTS